MAGATDSAGGSGFGDLACGQDFLDSWNDPVEEPRLPECIAAGQSHFSFRIAGVLGGNPKRHRHYRLELEDIRDIINEGLRLSCVDETDSRSVSCSQNGRFADAIETSCRGRKTAVGEISASPLGVVIVAAASRLRQIASPEAHTSFSPGLPQCRATVPHCAVPAVLP